MTSSTIKKVPILLSLCKIFYFSYSSKMIKKTGVEKVGRLFAQTFAA
ncbi:hypothetical protein LDG_8423 [Legionella drancourtii LLAP12]|uniref:Uncharacterized protein n=1 Tax=Legionella drancourtii LLAP12 TaxID=658187 RepID=G9ESZ4_9GAMM|nr:hypothetical protein LDG_8423 [Legionella drancourtii LLAP12]